MFRQLQMKIGHFFVLLSQSNLVIRNELLKLSPEMLFDFVLAALREVTLLISLVQ